MLIMNSKVDFPNESFKQGRNNKHNHKMKEHKIKRHRKISSRPLDIIPANHTPAGLREDLHQNKLGAHKRLKITKLSIHSIFHTRIIRHSISKQLHPNHTKNII